jgi:hypothetical protein
VSEPRIEVEQCERPDLDAPPPAAEVAGFRAFVPPGTVLVIPHITPHPGESLDRALARQRAATVMITNIGLEIADTTAAELSGISDTPTKSAT